jgi:hypothetical protein
LESRVFFELRGKRGLLDDRPRVRVEWEVANGGVGEDQKRQDIYYGRSTDQYGGKYKFERDVVYHGTHLLRCTVKNTNQKREVTQVFVVNGVP